MASLRKIRFELHHAVAAGAFVAFTVAGALTGLAAGQHVISQKGREFHPNTLSIAAGDTVIVINDDGDLRHHLYIDSSSLKFDSGDQEPGSRATISFPTIGSFDVLCAIHPKMRLGVRVN